MADNYHSEDITFCTQKDCSKKSCFRHMANIRDYGRDHTVAELAPFCTFQIRPEPPRRPRRRRKQ